MRLLLLSLSPVSLYIYISRAGPLPSLRYFLSPCSLFQASRGARHSAYAKARAGLLPRAEGDRAVAEALDELPEALDALMSA